MVKFFTIYWISSFLWHFLSNYFHAISSKHTLIPLMKKMFIVLIFATSGNAHNGNRQASLQLSTAVSKAESSRYQSSAAQEAAQSCQMRALSETLLRKSISGFLWSRCCVARIIFTVVPSSWLSPLLFHLKIIIQLPQASVLCRDASARQSCINRPQSQCQVSTETLRLPIVSDVGTSWPHLCKMPNMSWMLEHLQQTAH